MIHEFFIDCEPPRATAQGSSVILKNRKTGAMFVGKMSNSNAAKAKKLLTLLLGPYRPKEPFSGPVRLRVTWIYPWLKGATKAERARIMVPCEAKPDCDNLSKLLNDTLTALFFWGDDSQIFELHFLKWYGERPGIGIRIENYEIDALACQTTFEDLTVPGN